MQAPPGSRCSERAVVVCLPRLSCSRTAPVSCTVPGCAVRVALEADRLRNPLEADRLRN